MNKTSIRRALAHTTLAALLLTSLGGARAQSEASALSALSTLPIAVSVTAPVMVLSAGAVLTVVAVEASATGAVWVLERALREIAHAARPAISPMAKRSV